MKLHIKIVLVSFLLFANILFAQQNYTQKVTLNWSKTINYPIYKNKTIKTFLTDSKTVDSNLNPEFTTSWKLNNSGNLVDYEVRNIVYEALSSSEIKFLNKRFIPTEIWTDFNIVVESGISYGVLKASPIVKDGNSFKKVKSFDLSYSLSNLKKVAVKSSSVKNSVLSEGNWFKFSIDTTGVFKIDKTFLQNLGINVNNINPKNIKIYGNGGAMLPFKNSDFRYDGLQENAIQVIGEEDGVFNDSDYILFYGQGPHKWNIAENSIESTSHNFNIFSDKSYYFITVSNNQGKRIATSNKVATEGTVINSYHDFTFFEKDEINLFATGQQWFGDNFNIENSKSYTIPFENMDANQDIIVRVRGVVASGLPAQFQVGVNTQNTFTVNFSASTGLNQATAAIGETTLKSAGNSLQIQVTFNNSGNPSAKAYLDYIEVLGSKKLIANGKQFGFRNFDQANNIGSFTYEIENKDQINAVWDVTNPLIPKIVENQSNNNNFSFSLNGGMLQEFVVVNNNDFYIPELLEISSIQNQNLHSLLNIDYLIVTNNELKQQAQRLSTYHSLNSNLKTQVVSVQQIYNEFSSGSPDITAIRDFVKHLYDNATTNKIKFLCLFGDASYDYKDRIESNNNIVPVFEAYNSFNLATSFVTDDFYGMMDADEGEMQYFEKQDIATGRIPVSDPLQAQRVVDKILNYYSEKSLGAWRTNLTLMADDIDAPGEEVLQGNMEEIADTIAAYKPVFNLKKIYLDAYKQENSSGGERYPTVNTDLINQIEQGTLIVDYFGHGGEDGLASERVLEVQGIKSLNNFNKFPLFMTVTCEFSRFDNPLRDTAGEFMVWNENGGAVSQLSTTRAIFISIGRAINQELIKPLLNISNSKYSIAEALMVAKNKFTTSQRFFIFTLGDPAMHLAIPTPAIRLSSVNDVPISQSVDTIKALSYIKFDGEVINGSGGSISNNFNGELEVTVFDKPIQKTTLDNDNFNVKMIYNALESKVFKGKAEVVNGKFSFDFVAPKDLKIAYGKGKLSFYAKSGIEDKAGSNFDLVIGGINTDAPVDNIGPEIRLFLNDLNFVEGGTTNSSPLLIAELKDENGINTSITAVDHDIVAILDNDTANPIILNDYYQTELNSYKIGKVNYPFKNLTPGLHTITLKAWDTYNNPSEATLNFFVVDDSELVLNNVLNYPNPFVNYTEFWFNHNKPNELLNVQIQIFTISGKLVKTINEVVQSEGNLSRKINWNGLDDFGSKIAKGVYVYKLKVKALNSNNTAEKIEKLVIL